MKRLLYKNILSHILLILIRLLYKTYRVKIINGGTESNIFERGLRPVYISWHQRLLPGSVFLSGRKPIAIMVSRSRDGDLAAKIIRMQGWHPVRGSSSRGAVTAFNQVKELAASGYSLGHIVDGPRGPFGKVKPGLIMLAKITGMPVLPVIISAKKKWVLNSWDRFHIPKPFTRIIIKFGQEIYIPSKTTKEGIELYRRDIQDKLYAYYKEVDEYWT
jgi:lysophospholipid acyltransferase (LPLAT)-like uncharacterized protein